MIELNKNCFSYDELLKRWESSSSGSDVGKQIEIRMIELNKEQLAKLPDTTNCWKRWESSSSGSDVEKQIEIRMIELNKEQLAKIASYDELLEAVGKFKFRFRC